MARGNDFVLVRLTPAGEAHAGGHPLRHSNGRISILFNPGKPVRVAKFEWDLLLKVHNTPDGSTWFELVDEAHGTGLGTAGQETT